MGCASYAEQPYEQCSANVVGKATAHYNSWNATGAWLVPCGLPEVEGLIQSPTSVRLLFSRALIKSADRSFGCDIAVLRVEAPTPAHDGCRDV